MSSRITRRQFLLSSTSILSGCGASLANFPFDSSFDLNLSLGIEVTFYGVGCSRISYAGVGILTDPFWSYLPFRQVAIGTVLPDPKQVDPYIDQLSDVQAVMIGHNHYDHNLDLPYVAPHLNSNAYILGSQTMLHTFAANGMSTPMVALNSVMADRETPGEWWVHPSKRFRVLAILSDHPNQYLFLHLFQQKLDEDRDTPPRKAGDYQEGVTMAFLVDYLDDSGEVERRIYIQTSSTGYPMGFFPPSILIEHPIDVALLAMDCANLEMNNQFTIIDYLDPKVVLFCHWEDFFRNKEQTPREIVKVDLVKAKQHFVSTPTTKYLFPGWDSTFQL